MARAAQDVTERELAVLQALWGGGPATIREHPPQATGHASTGGAFAGK